MYYIFIFTLVTCARPPPPAFGSYDQGYPDELIVGDHVTYRCVHGYILNGPATIVCQDDGTWNPSIPTCEKGGRSNFDFNY